MAGAKVKPRFRLSESGRAIAYGAALIGATVGMAVGKAYRRQPSVTVALSAASFVIATLLATGAALLLGMRLGPGVLVVGSSFGGCLAASGVLYTLGGQTKLGG